MENPLQTLGQYSNKNNINIQKSMAFICTNNNELEDIMKEKTQFTQTTINNNNNLVIRLTRAT